MSGLTTPLGTDETMGQQEQIPTNPQAPPAQPLVQPVILEDHTAEMFGMVAQLESAIKTVHDHTFSCQKELQFMVADNRAAQKHAADLQLVTTGWPNGLTPQQREYMLGWMLGNTPEIVAYLQARGLLAQNYDHTALSPNGFASFWFNVLSTDPVTVPQKAGLFSGMTLLSFKSWDLRSAFLRRYGGTSGMPLYIDQNTPQPNKHVRVSPFTPQWQRKLETPLRVLIAACNAHPETQGKRLIILWTSSLTTPPGPASFMRKRAALLRAGLKLYRSLLPFSTARLSKRTGVKKPCGLKSGIRQFGATSSNWTIWNAKRTTPPARRQQQEGLGPSSAAAASTGHRPFCTSPLFHHTPLSWSLLVWTRLRSFGTSCAINATSRTKRLEATFCGKPAVPDHTANSAEDLLASAGGSAAKAAGKGKAASSQSTPPPA